MQELDSPTPPHILTLLTSPQKPHFRLSTASDWGGAQVDYPNERSVLEVFQCEKAASNSYRFGAVRAGMRAMSVGSKVSVRTDGEGVLSLNFMVDVEGKNVFVEFKVVPNVEDESEEE
jgi:cell cycle checkpoint protein